MARIDPFEKRTEDYDFWFTKNYSAYLSELMAVGKQLPQSGKGLEIGVGTGRFAGPLGIEFGLEPSGHMRKIARQRGIQVVGGIAEALPYADGQFNLALMVTTICFLDDIEASFREVHRILKPNGIFVVGFIDKDSLLGRQYEKNRSNSQFYKTAVFNSVDDVVKVMKLAGFGDFEFVQTIFNPLNEINSIEPVTEGYGRGSFVAIKGRK